MDCNKLREITIEAVYETLDPDDQRALDDHLRDCPACRRRLEEAKALLGAYREMPRPTPPAGAVRSALALAQAGGDADEEDAPAPPGLIRRIAFHPALAAAAVLAIVVTVAFEHWPRDEAFRRRMAEGLDEARSARNEDAGEEKKEDRFAGAAPDTAEGPLLPTEPEEAETQPDSAPAAPAAVANAPEGEDSGVAAKAPPDGRDSRAKTAAGPDEDGAPPALGEGALFDPDRRAERESAPSGDVEAESDIGKDARAPGRPGAAGETPATDEATPDRIATDLKRLSRKPPVDAPAEEHAAGPGTTANTARLDGDPAEGLEEFARETVRETAGKKKEARAPLRDAPEPSAPRDEADGEKAVSVVRKMEQRKAPSSESDDAGLLEKTEGELRDAAQRALEGAVQTAKRRREAHGTPTASPPPPPATEDEAQVFGRPKKSETADAADASTDGIGEVRDAETPDDAGGGIAEGAAAPEGGPPPAEEVKGIAEASARNRRQALTGEEAPRPRGRTVDQLRSYTESPGRAETGGRGRVLQQAELLTRAGRADGGDAARADEIDEAFREPVAGQSQTGAAAAEASDDDGYAGLVDPAQAADAPAAARPRGGEAEEEEKLARRRAVQIGGEVRADIRYRREEDDERGGAMLSFTEQAATLRGEAPASGADGGRAGARWTGTTQRAGPAAPRTPWSPVVNGLRARIAFAGGRTSSRFRPGEPVLVRYVVQNAGDRERVLYVAGFWPNHRIEVIGPDGGAAPLTAAGRLRREAFDPGGARDRNAAMPLAPGASDDEMPVFDLREFYRLDEPGRYAVRYVYAERGGEGWTGELWSNRLGFEILPAEAAARTTADKPAAEIRKPGEAGSVAEETVRSRAAAVEAAREALDASDAEIAPPARAVPEAGQ